MVKRVVGVIQVSGVAGAPTGQPPTVHPKGTSTAVEIVAAEGDVGSIRALLASGLRYENAVTFTSDTSFTETGTMVVGDGGHRLHIVNQGQGYLAPTPDPKLLNGAVTWRIASGDGAFAGATGLLASNFLLAAEEGTYTEQLAATIFVP